ncbi:hypothetical protein GOODEAATRI_033491 [Goodea atripinnis]|uniref:Uncharacterized protein n=1 Tax=Goodea atripinnis TaxID=208336 RepID=A0ABV0MYP5_9TELE
MIFVKNKTFLTWDIFPSLDKCAAVKGWNVLLKDVQNKRKQCEIVNFVFHVSPGVSVGVVDAVQEVMKFIYSVMQKQNKRAKCTGVKFLVCMHEPGNKADSEISSGNNQWFLQRSHVSGP